MGFNFPATPAQGEIYQPTGGPAYQWDGEKWRGGAISGPQKEQFFDLSGKTQQDITVPTWAKMCQIEGAVFLPAVNWTQIQVSDDGTTFKATTGDYQVAGPYHNTGTSAYTKTDSIATYGMTVDLGGDTSIPRSFSATVTVERSGAGQVFHMRSFATAYANAAGSLYRTFWQQAYVAGAATSALRLKALRILPGGGVTTFATGSRVHIRWMGDDAQIPSYSVFAVNDQWNGTETYTPGTTVVTPADDGKLFAMTLGAGSVFTLPNIADVPNGWRVLVRAVGSPSAANTNYVNGGSAQINYGNSYQLLGANNRMTLIGAGEVIRFRKNDTVWYAEIVMHPVRDMFLINVTSSGSAYINPPTTLSIAPGGVIIGSTPTGVAQASNLGFIAPVSGIYRVLGRVYANADGVGGATKGNMYIYLGSNTAAEGGFQSNHIWTGTGGGYVQIEKTLFLHQQQNYCVWYYCGVNTLVVYPPNFFFEARLVSR